MMIEGIRVTTIFAIGIGIGLCLLIAFVIVVSIVCKTFKETTGSLENILKGPTLPIITVIVIVGTITLLALLGILKENSITAILGGIVGYVLGGVKKDH
jgi:O-antigen/teichoic acid export membrane protein